MTEDASRCLLCEYAMALADLAGEARDLGVPPKRRREVKRRMAQLLLEVTNIYIMFVAGRYQHQRGNLLEPAASNKPYSEDPEENHRFWASVVVGVMSPNAERILSHGHLTMLQLHT